MKAKLKLDSTGCPINLFSVITENAKWIDEAATSKSASVRTRVVVSHILNTITDTATKCQAVTQLYKAAELVDTGIDL